MSAGGPYGGPLSEARRLAGIPDPCVGMGGEDPCDLVHRHRPVRPERERGLEMAEGLVPIAHRAEREAEVVLRLGVVRLRAERRAKLDDRLAQPALRSENAAQAVVRPGEPR